MLFILKKRGKSDCRWNWGGCLASMIMPALLPAPLVNAAARRFRSQKILLT
jgi:hypothetical protein